MDERDKEALLWELKTVRRDLAELDAAHAAVVAGYEVKRANLQAVLEAKTEIGVACGVIEPPSAKNKGKGGK